MQIEVRREKRENVQERDLCRFRCVESLRLDRPEGGLEGLQLGCELLIVSSRYLFEEKGCLIQQVLSLRHGLLGRHNSRPGAEDLTSRRRKILGALPPHLSRNSQIEKEMP